MPNISDHGILLNYQFYGEDRLKILVLTENYGINSGFVKSDLRSTALYQIGNLLEFTWVSNLDRQFIHVKGEIIQAFWPQYVSNEITTCSVKAITSVLCQALSELQPHHKLFRRLLTYLKGASLKPFSFASYIKMELALLEASGYGISIDKCVLTGSSEQLRYVAPDLGGPVNASAKQLYHGKLLSLPSFLPENREPESQDEKRQAFILTSYFFRKYLGNLNFEARTTLIKCLIL